MAGTLYVYDEAFPRASAQGKPIRNTPSADELRANKYPEPYRMLPILEASSETAYFKEIADAAEAMKPLDRLIIFGHGRVVNAAEGTAVVKVTTGIQIGARDITAFNAASLGALAGKFSKNAQAELWVCDAAAAGTSGGQGGQVLCQNICDALGVPVLAADIVQTYETKDQVHTDEGWRSTLVFLPFEGTVITFKPRAKKK